ASWRSHRASISSLSDVARQTNAAELPALVGMEEVPVAGARMPRRRGERSAAQHHLVDHELSVVLADRTCDRPIPRIWVVGAARPRPDMRRQFADLDVSAGGSLPLRLGREPRTGPARE